MKKLIDLFPKLRKLGYKINGFSAPFGVEITQEIRNLGGITTNRGHVPGMGECKKKKCKKYHCPAWDPPIGATMYELAHINRDGYYLIILKNKGEVLIEKRGGEGITSLATCLFDRIPNNFMAQIRESFT